MNQFLRGETTDQDTGSENSIWETYSKRIIHVLIKLEKYMFLPKLDSDRHLHINTNSQKNLNGPCGQYEKNWWDDYPNRLPENRVADPKLSFMQMSNILNVVGVKTNSGLPPQQIKRNVFSIFWNIPQSIRTQIKPVNKCVMWHLMGILSVD